MNTKIKVLAYIFRVNNGVRELLVFDHRDFPEVNPQVPGGTVEYGEALASAVLREVHEESGLELQMSSQYLGCFDYFLEGSNQIHKRHVYAFETDSLNDQWEHIVTAGGEDKGLYFDYCWLPISDAKKRLVSNMGDYLE